MSQTEANDLPGKSKPLPEGFYTQAEVDNADKRIKEGEFANREEALAVIKTERGADAVLRGDSPVTAEREDAGASFPPAGASPSIGEASSMGAPPIDPQPEDKPLTLASIDDQRGYAQAEVDALEPEPEPEPEPVVEPEPEVVEVPDEPEPEPVVEPEPEVVEVPDEPEPEPEKEGRRG